MWARIELLLGKANIAKLQNSKVAVIGVGGVGSYVVEGLVRSGVGHLVLLDGDIVCMSNLNRQLQATWQTLGEKKIVALKERMLAISPKLQVELIDAYYSGAATAEFFSRTYDYVADAADNIEAKVNLAVECAKRAIPIIASMGTGNKLDPTQLEVADIYQTSVDPLARIMRKKLKMLGVKQLKVVYSKEKPISAPDKMIGSVPFVPAVAGMIMAGEIVKDICRKGND